MATGSGLAAQLGIGEETTYGTYPAGGLTRWLEWDGGGTPQKQKNTIQGGGLGANRLGKLGSRRVDITEWGMGAPPMELTNKGMGLLLKHTFGGVPTITQQGATAAWLQSHPLTDNVGRMLSVQGGIPDKGGVIRPFTGKGGKITQAEFSCENGGLLKVTPTFDFQKVSEAESLAAPSPLTGVRPFHFGQLSVKIGTLGAEASVDGVKAVSLTVARPQYTDGFYAGAGGLKSVPVMNDVPVVSGSITADFLDKTLFADKFSAGTPTALIFEWVGPLIAATFFETFRLKVPMIFFDGDTPVAEGFDVVSGQFPFTAALDGTNPLVTAEYQSVDLAA